MATVSVKHHQMFIDGKDVDAAEVYEIRSPATEELVATMAKGSVEHADAAVDAARRAFESGSWSRKSQEDRSAIMTRIANRLGEELEEIIELETCANGATVRQATGFHCGLASPHFLYFAEQALTYEFERAVATKPYPTHSVNTIVREPIGVCAAIVPWNFPLVLGIWKIGPALAAGNSIVVKPDEKTPLSLLRLAQIAHEEGVPDGVFNIVSGDGAEVGARLASHPDVDKIAFTGSTAIGREIMRLASGTVKKVSLELGGKAPVIMLKDADLSYAIDGALFGCMLYSGQICESGTRLFVHRDKYDEVVAKLVDRASTITLGDPTDFDTDMGPVVSGRQRDRILSYLEQAKADGATFALGGGAPDGDEFAKGYWISPTIITNVTNDMQIAREEIFGPVMVVIPYDTVDDAVAMANDNEYGLTAGLWASDLEEALEVGARLRAGTVWINNWHAVDPALPFGGYKQSGVGRELGPGALDEYTESKHVHLDLSTDVERLPFDLLVSAPQPK
ncbi:Betaine aldehyde dehydrogenase [Paraconexibacter sp. AEG42_29]|uniref:Betaine aldehyde dehydrogenase n=1 Tax=Paraconexibacter sp. AEG42_29 TaxID=2997339 RepID=A0AAU7AQX0_9ACTN